MPSNKPTLDGIRTRVTLKGARATQDRAVLLDALDAVLALIPLTNPELIEAGYGVDAGDLLAEISAHIDLGGKS